MSEPNQSLPDQSSLTAKQRAVLDYLREHGPTRQDVLAEAMGSTLRGVGVILSALVWRDDIVIRARRNAAEGTEATEWSV